MNQYPSHIEPGHPLSPALNVLVVGAGPTGLMLARELLRRGVSCRLIDRLPGPPTTSRALGIQPRTLELFEQMNIVAPILDQGVPLWDTLVYDSRGTLVMRLNWRALPQVPYPYQLVVPQAHTERVLHNSLLQQGGQVEWQRELVKLSQDEQGVTAQVKISVGESPSFETIHVRYVIGCDGAHSLVRKSLAIPFDGYSLPGHFWLADVELGWERSQEHVYAWVHQDGTISMMPLPGSRQWRLLVHMAHPDKDFEEVTLERMRKVFATRTGEPGEVIQKATWLSDFHIHQRIVTTYRQGNVFLAGDAAHIHSPAGGQGLNTGIADAYNLAWKLALVLRKQAREQLLETYEVERLPVAREVLRRSGEQSELIFSQQSLKSKLVVPLLGQLMQLPVVQQRIALAGSQLLVNYRTSPLSVTRHQYRRRSLTAGVRRPTSLPPVQAGDRAPQATFLDLISGRPGTVFQLFQDGKSHLLLFSGKKGNAVEAFEVAAALAEEIAIQWGAVITPHLISVEKPTSSNLGGSLLLDPEHELHLAYNVSGPTLVLLRPDGYIGFISHSIDRNDLMQYLQTFFVSGI